jgi:hypothetical protein
MQEIFRNLAAVGRKPDNPNIEGYYKISRRNLRCEVIERLYE